MENKSIAILYVCTGKYTVFWKEFYISCMERFIPEYHKEFFVFTDAASVYNEEQDEGIHRIYQKNLGWPGNTLMRYEMFMQLKEKISIFDYTVFFNANTYFVKTVTAEEFLPHKEGIVVAQHPAFTHTDRYMFPYERHKKSTAYIPYSLGKDYVTGSVNGGKTDAYFEMVAILRNRTNDDLQNGITAIWHDESQLNKYIADCDDYRLLSPSYCYTEGIDFGYEPIIMMRDKNRYFSVTKLKKNMIYIWWCGAKRHAVYAVLKTRDFFLREKG